MNIVLDDSPIAPKPEEKKGFKCRRFLIFFLMNINHNLLFFQRSIPSIISASMADSYHCEVADLGVFSSMFFYPYAAVQPFAALLADVIEPGYLLCASTLIASTGALICGLSKTLFIGSIGRFLVGFGSAPIYSVCCRCIANWVPLKYYSRTVGFYIAFVSLGSLIAQGPFSLISDMVPWQWCFLTLSIIGFILAILIGIFVRGNPIKLGFNSVNLETAIDHSGTGIKTQLRQLLHNIRTVMSNWSFWTMSAFNFLLNGPFYTIQGMWSGPYLRDILSFSDPQTGNVIMGTSIGGTIGSAILPLLAEFFKAKKWFVLTSTLISMISLVPFIFFNDMHFILIFALFFIYGMFSNAITNVAYPIVREYYHASVSATAVGCLNSFSFAGSAVCQLLVGEFIKSYGVEVDGVIKYTVEGYRNCLWIPSVVLTFVSAICLIVSKDVPSSKKKDNQNIDSNDNLTSQLLSNDSYQSIGLGYDITAK